MTDTTPTTPPAAGDAAFQSRVDQWIQRCFGPEIGADRIERNHRFLEEALELVQAGGCTASEAHQLVDYVFGRPVGELGQEVGGVMNTLAALCTAHGVSLSAEAERELQRVWTKVDAIRAKQAAKPKHSPLPETPPDAGDVRALAKRLRDAAALMRQEKAVFCPAALLDAAAALERLATSCGHCGRLEQAWAERDAALKERDEAREDSVHMLAMMMGERDAERAARERAEAALREIIVMNRQYAADRYGDADRAEGMACVVVARAALQPQPQPQGGE